MKRPGLKAPSALQRLGKRTGSRGRGFGNASPVCGLEAEADLARKSVVRACETPEYFAEHGCPHGRAKRQVVAAALILALLLPGCASVHKGDIAIAAASSADAVSTEVLVTRDNLEEANPLLQDQAVRLAVKAAATAGAIYLHRHYKKKGEEKKAKAVVILLVGLWGGAFAWNLHQAEKAQ